MDDCLLQLYKWTELRISRRNKQTLIANTAYHCKPSQLNTYNGISIPLLEKQIGSRGLQCLTGKGNFGLVQIIGNFEKTEGSRNRDYTG